MKYNKTTDMTSGAVIPQLIRFILPLIGASLFQQLYNTVDFLFVGNFLTKTSAAAVGASATLISITVGLFSGISVGTSIVAAQAVGCKDREMGEKAIHSSVVFGIIGGLAVMTAGIAFAPQILTVLRTPAEVMDEAVLYIRIYLLSVPMLVFYNMVSGGLRAQGDSQTPFTVMAVCGLLNVLMDAVFIVWIPLGVAGVAVATAITQSMSALFIGIRAASPDREIRLSLKKLHIDGAVLKKVLKIGLPTGFQTIILTFSNVMVQYYINDFGETAVAAFAAYYKVENLIYLPITAFGQAAATFAGQNTGAMQYKRIRSGTLITVLLGCGVTAAIAFTILVSPRTVFTWFIKDQSVVTEALKIALVSFPLYWIYPILEIFGGALRGMGYSLGCMAVTIACMCVIRITLLEVFTVIYHTIQALGAVYPVTWACAAVSFTVFFAAVMKKKLGESRSPE
ncbi:MAG: MATE family efflux transporter [Ruminiclostridium sp.]|nr:MATE family efflux transporter [Ruminiclostridium sp.]